MKCLIENFSNWKYSVIDYVELIDEDEDVEFLVEDDIVVVYEVFIEDDLMLGIDYYIIVYECLRVL